MALNDTHLFTRVSPRLLGWQVSAGPCSHPQVRLRPNRLPSSFVVGRIHFLATNGRTWGLGFWPHRVLFREASKAISGAVPLALLYSLGDKGATGPARTPTGRDRRGPGSRKACRAHRPSERNRGRKGHGQPAGEGGVATSCLCLRLSQIQSPNRRDLSPPTTRSRIF